MVWYGRASVLPFIEAYKLQVNQLVTPHITHIFIYLYTYVYMYVYEKYVNIFGATILIYIFVRDVKL